MALLSAIRNLFGRTPSPRAETNVQDQERTSEDTYYTASEGSLSGDAEAFLNTARHEPSPLVVSGSMASGIPIMETTADPATDSAAYNLKELSKALDAIAYQPTVPPSKIETRQFSDRPLGISAVGDSAHPIEPSQSSVPVQAPGTYGYRYKERERLARYGHDISGGVVDDHGKYCSRFESEHLYSFATAHPYPLKRTSREGKDAADKGPAYYELGDLHRAHISSHNTYDVVSGKIKIEGSDHGWKDPGVFRNHVRSALRDPKTMGTGENLSVAGQLHILDYGFIHQRAHEKGSPYGAYPDYATLSAARNSFGYMLKSSPTVHISDNTGSGRPADTQQISAKTRAELILAHQAAVESEYPSFDDVRRVAKGVLHKKDYDEKQGKWDAEDKVLHRSPYDERTRTRGRW